MRETIWKDEDCGKLDKVSPATYLWPIAPYGRQVYIGRHAFFKRRKKSGFLWEISNFLGAVLGFELRAYEALHRYSLNLSPSCILWEKICSSLTRESVISVLLASSFVFLTDPYMTTQ
jgi:hypothetical protein